MNFNPTTCPDCQYPPNFIVRQIPNDKENFFSDSPPCRKFGVTCRDCGDYWEEEE